VTYPQCNAVTLPSTVTFSTGTKRITAGFVTEASRQGVALPAIMAMTEHRAVSSVMGYFQTGGATGNPAARLLEDG
jgi:hypothetical protein